MLTLNSSAKVQIDADRTNEIRGPSNEPGKNDPRHSPLGSRSYKLIQCTCRTQCDDDHFRSRMRMGRVITEVSFCCFHLDVIVLCEILYKKPPDILKIRINWQETSKVHLNFKF